jgi:hypothetical protein
VDLIGEHARSEHGGRGVRLREPGPPRRVGRQIEAERGGAS